jgi:hypothetical protein
MRTLPAVRRQKISIFCDVEIANERTDCRFHDRLVVSERAERRFEGSNGRSEAAATWLEVVSDGFGGFSELDWGGQR